MALFSYKAGVVCVGIIRVSRHLKEGLAWTTDKWFQVISNITLLKTVIPPRN